MARKSTWLPRQTQPERYREPGREHDSMNRGRWGGPGLTPLEDLFWAVVLLAGAIALVVAGISLGGLSREGLIFAGLSLPVFGAVIYLVRRCVLRWLWRRNNVELTGGVYLRPWERTPTTLDR